MRRAIMMLSIVVLLGMSCYGEPPWHTELWGSGNGYWQVRVPVVVENHSASPVTGYVISLRVGEGMGEVPLAGQFRERLRICNSSGTEYLYEVVSSRRNYPMLLREDELCFAVDVPAGGRETFYIYADNPIALPGNSPSLHASLRNGGFEEGLRSPDHWTASLTSEKHLAQYRLREGRNNSRCVYHRVRLDATPAWVQWSQGDILVTPGRRYVLRGWVRARNSKGQVGYYVHVNGIRPQMVNIVQSAGEGTYDWRQVEVRFVVPPGGQTARVGTVLYGEGEAWYDDVSLEPERDAELSVRWQVLPPERVLLRYPLARHDAWNSTWLVRASVLVRNFSRDTVGRVVTVSLPRAIHMVRRLVGDVRMPMRVQVVDPQNGRTMPAVWIGEMLCFEARLQPLTEHRFDVYFSREQAGEENLRAYQQLLHSSSNLAREGDFEPRERALKMWSSGGETTGAGGFMAEVVSPGRFGKNAVRLHVPPERQQDWLGWRQLNVPVQPSARYLYAAWVKTQGVADGTVDIHGHFKAVDNSFAKGAQFFSSERRLSGDNDWTLCYTEIVTPADAHHVELHLTMNAHGTVWHDGVLFLPTEQGIVRKVEANPARLPGEPFSVWQVNPLVKVFPDDPPRPMAKEIVFEAARNEWEPVQLALWSQQPLNAVRVEVTPLKHQSGAVLSAPIIYRVMTVPIDVPTNYYVSRLPQYCRHVPRGAPSCDGWAGEWPDPLRQGDTFALTERRTQALWIEWHIPDHVPAGEYHGSIRIRGKTVIEIPIRATVWDFTLPRKSHLRIVYDLRSGPGWDVTGGENSTVLKQWYRLMAEHRVNPDTVIPAPDFRYEYGRVVMDVSRFEPMARYAFDELGFNHCYTPWIFYALGWAYPLSPKFGLQPRTPEYEKALREAYAQLVDYFTRNGWRDRLVYYLSDEPHLGNPQVVEDLRYFIGVVKPVAPDVPIFSSTWGHSPSLDGYLTMWGSGQFGVFPVQRMRERRSAGDRLLFTTDGQQALDTPYLATERLLPLYCFVYDVEGYEFWGFSWWTNNPWRMGWHQYILQSDQGQDFYWIRYPNGDGYLAYPADGGVAPVPSIRLKAVREGAEDYEYYLLWKQAVERAQQLGMDVSSAQALRQQMESLVPIPNAGGLRSTQILPDPETIYQLRRGIARQILQWMKE
ncbi:MAG: glycoside hydrolase domain-containing protein [Armatimonadota bacterium]